MIEWHLIPTDLATLPCPTIGFTNDFDMHIQGVHRWYHGFDAMVVIDQAVEHPAIKRISKVPTYAYPMVFGVPADLPASPNRPRDIDLFMSGTMLSAYHPDKARLLHQLMAIEKAKLLVIDGHLGVDNYWELLARSKITPSFCRHPGGIQTRVIEALSMGSISLVQPESIMRLWAGEEQGLFVFDERIGPEPEIRRILANYAAIAAGCAANIPTIRAAFEPRMIASRFFRFCTFLAARPRGERDFSAHQFLSQKRVMFVHGPRLAPDQAALLAEKNDERLARLALDYGSAEFANARAREWMLLYADGSYYSEADLNRAEFLAKAFDRARETAAAFPDRLVPRFNLIRMLLHFGGSGEIAEAIDMAAETVARPEHHWQVDPSEDVYPYDFFSDWFNYRRYLDAVVSALQEGSLGDGLVRLMLASLHHYLAVVKPSLAAAEQAHALDPEFPVYGLTLAEMLARGGNPAQEKRAIGILLDLARHSMVALRAYRQLRAIEERIGRRFAEIEAMDGLFERCLSTFIQAEHHIFKLFSPYFVADDVRAGGVRGVRIDKPPAPGPRPLLSLLVCGQAGVGCQDLLESLQRHRGNSLIESVYVDCYGTPPDGLQQRADQAVSLNQRGFLENRSLALLAALSHARGKIAVFVEPGHALDPLAARHLLEAFYGASVATATGSGVAEPRRLALFRSGPGGARLLAARVVDIVGIGGPSPHELFLGEAPILDELVERLARYGVPVRGLDAPADAAAERPHWWEAGRMRQAPHIIDIARRVWPAIFDERRTTPAIHLPATLVESVNANNIVKFHNFYLVVPQRLGPVNLELPAERQRPEILAAAGLAEARALAVARPHQRPSFRFGIRQRIRRWLQASSP